MRRALAALLLLAATPAAAQTGAIQDNSFLVEEAYNQDRGVVQHINMFTRVRGGEGWAYTFTQEWPLGGLRDQGSYTLPVLRDGDGTALGDLQLNYRRQWIGSGETRVAVAPRATLQLPTGSERVGAGKWAVQAAIPASVVLAPRWVAHTNVGATHTFGDGQATGAALGQSVVFLLRPLLNLMLESTYNVADLGGGGGDLVVSPGVRGGINTRGGAQIVGGVALPFGVAGSRDRSLLLYLSVEHPFTRARE